MASCTFFGHRDCPQGIYDKLKEAVERLIEECGVTVFYVGNHGMFDRLAAHVLRELKKSFSHIRYYIVLAYRPVKEDEYDNDETLLPFGIEKVPKRFAILWRNDWMLKKADYVITYTVHTLGGAARFEEKAKRSGKHVIELYE